MPVDDPSVAHIVDFHVKGFARLDKLWPQHFATLAAADEPGRFVSIPGAALLEPESGWVCRIHGGLKSTWWLETGRLSAELEG